VGKNRTLKGPGSVLLLQGKRDVKVDCKGGQHPKLPNERQLNEMYWKINHLNLGNTRAN